MEGAVPTQKGKILDVAEIPWVSIMVDIFLASLGYLAVSKVLVHYMPEVLAYLLVWTLLGLMYFVYALRKGGTVHAAFYYAYGAKASFMIPWLIAPAFYGPGWWKIPVVAGIAWFVYHYV